MTKENTLDNDDYLLAVAIGQGDKEAFGRLYDKYAPPLLGIITRIIPGNDAAEQILQTTFLLIWNQIGLFDASKNSFFTWLLKIARQLAIVNANAAQLKNPLHNNSVYDGADKNDKGQPCQTATQKLIFEMVFYKGVSCAMAAAKMSMPVEEIRRSIRMAIKNINAIKVL